MRWQGEDRSKKTAGTHLKAEFEAGGKYNGND